MYCSANVLQLCRGREDQGKKSEYVKTRKDSAIKNREDKRKLVLRLFFKFCSVNISKSRNKIWSELESKESVEEGPLETTKKGSYLKWKVDELGSK